MYTSIFSSNVNGISAHVIKVESDILRGLPGFSIVGLPDTSVNEAKERVKAAIQNSGYQLPAGKITVNLSPAEIRKNGSNFDLPIALALLISAKEIKNPDSNLIKNTIFLGELGLSGEIHPVKGALPMILECYQKGFKSFVVPEQNKKELSLLHNINIYTASKLKDVCIFITGNSNLNLSKNTDFTMERKVFPFNFSEVKGQFSAKRALEISAAGNHNILMLGSPGSGKTMLAKRLPGILPDMNFNEMIQTTKIYSISGKLQKNNTLIYNRPFRSPHHTISDAALIGGGSNPKPGEISLAHNGVLFLDEMTEFRKSTLEVLRQPLTDKSVTVARAKDTYTFPANFMLVGAANPCPCGFLFDDKKQCICTYKQQTSYRQKLSGPIMDRFDITLQISRVKTNDLINISEGEKSEDIRKRVNNTRKLQEDRFNDFNIFTNSEMNSTMIKKFCKLENKTINLLKNAIEKFGMSARAYFKIIKVARTIADIEENSNIKENHILEAIQYRLMDKW